MIVNDCMMEDAGEVKFSCGYVETKAKLTVNINEEWRRLQAEKAEAAKGGESLSKISIQVFLYFSSKLVYRFFKCVVSNFLYSKGRIILCIPSKSFLI